MIVQNGGAEASMDWILSHLDDADLNDPLPVSNTAVEPAAEKNSQANAESIDMLSAMGFTRDQVQCTLSTLRAVMTYSTLLFFK